MTWLLTDCLLQLPALPLSALKKEIAVTLMSGRAPPGSSKRFLTSILTFSHRLPSACCDAPTPSVAPSDEASGAAGASTSSDARSSKFGALPHALSTLALSESAIHHHVVLIMIRGSSLGPAVAGRCRAGRTSAGVSGCRNRAPPKSSSPERPDS